LNNRACSYNPFVDNRIWLDCSY